MTTRNKLLLGALILTSALCGCGSDETTGETGGAGDSGAAGSGGAGGSTATGGSSGNTTGGQAGAEVNPPAFHPQCDDLPATRVIGNWDVVPYQRFTGSFEVGVVAFHERGLDVVLSVNGAEVARVGDPTRNPRTGVYEYWHALEASDFPDGEVEVTATLEPDCDGHLPRELDPLVLIADAGGSMTNATQKWVDCAAGSDSNDGTETAPFATIEKGLVEAGSGGTVLLAAGDCYVLTTDLPSAGLDRWTTVMPAAGVPREQVRIMADGPGSTGRFGEDFVRWSNVQLVKDVDPGYSTMMYMESGHHVWFDGAELIDLRGKWNGGQIMGGNTPYHAYYTDTVIREFQNTQLAFNRNVTVEGLGSDALRAYGGLMSIGLTIRGIDRGETDAHPDFIQFYNPDGVTENVVVYNAAVYDMGAQGIFGGPGEIRDVAVVNLLMEKDPPDSALISQISGSWNHALFWHITTVDSGMLLREPEGQSNFFIQNCLWDAISAGDAVTLPGFFIDHNHVTRLTWDQPGPMGTNATVGDPLFTDETGDDYTLQSGSPAAGTGTPLPGVPADLNGTWYDGQAPSIGAFEN